MDQRLHQCFASRPSSATILCPLDCTDAALRRDVSLVSKYRITTTGWRLRPATQDTDCFDCITDTPAHSRILNVTGGTISFGTNCWPPNLYKPRIIEVQIFIPSGKRKIQRFVRDRCAAHLKEWIARHPGGIRPPYHRYTNVDREVAY